MSAEVLSYFDKQTNTVSHIAIDPQTNRCAIIDSVLNYYPSSGKTSTESADLLIAAVKEQGLIVDWILETHVHADHLSAAPYLQCQLGGKKAVGSSISNVQKVFGEIYNFDAEFDIDGSQFDKLFDDGENFYIGNIKATAVHTPGHTPACMTYLVGDSAFVGDTLFMPDFGTARCDFPGGNAEQLYQSVQKLYKLPDNTKLYMCHDYLTVSRNEYQWQTTVGEQKNNNVHLNCNTQLEDFVNWRKQRDAQLNMPALMLPSVQVNIRAGDLPPREENGTHYLKIPINAF